MLIFLTCRQIKERPVEFKVSDCIYPERAASQRNSVSSKILQSNFVSSIISMTFVPFKHRSKRCRPTPWTLVYVNACTLWCRQSSDFVPVQELDEAARRRMPKQLYIPLPCAAARRQMIERQLGESRLACLLHDLPSRACYSLCCVLPVKPSCLRLFVVQWRVLCNPVGRYSCAASKLV